MLWIRSTSCLGIRAGSRGRSAAKGEAKIICAICVLILSFLFFPVFNLFVMARDGGSRLFI